VPKVLEDTKKEKDIYMNVNLSWELWKDVKIGWLKSLTAGNLANLVIIQRCPFLKNLHLHNLNLECFKFRLLFAFEDNFHPIK
jgi:hypothetical protein